MVNSAILTALTLLKESAGIVVTVGTNDHISIADRPRQSRAYRLCLLLISVGTMLTQVCLYTLIPIGFGWRID